MSKREDALFNYLGLDAKYERDLVYYRPVIQALRSASAQHFPEETLADLKYLRASEFTLSKVIAQYRSLIERLRAILREIEVRERPDRFITTNELYQEKDYEKLISYEFKEDHVTNRNFIDFTYICLWLIDSLDTRLVKILDHYATQLTEDKSDEGIRQAEEASLAEFRTLLYTVDRLESTANQIINEDDHNHGMEDDEPVVGHYDSIKMGLQEDVQQLIDEKNITHQAMADLSLIHQNRCAMINEMCDIIEAMVKNAFNLYNEDLEEAIHVLHENDGSRVLLASAAMQFDALKTKHTQKKRKLFTYQEKMESFAFDKQFFYQQMEKNYNNPALTLAGNFIYTENEALKRFNHTIVSSVEKNKASYNSVIKEMLNYYKEEAGILKEVLDIAIDKEESRLYYRIAEDVSLTPKMTSEWMTHFYDKMTNY